MRAQYSHRVPASLQSTTVCISALPIQSLLRINRSHSRSPRGVPLTQECCCERGRAVVVQHIGSNLPAATWNQMIENYYFRIGATIDKWAYIMSVVADWHEKRERSMRCRCRGRHCCSRQRQDSDRSPGHVHMCEGYKCLTFYLGVYSACQNS